jgi:hypothetical protein
MASSAPRRLIPPRPLADFSTIALDTVTARQTIWFRLSDAAYASPLFFSRQGIFRFDSATAKWGVCYLAQDIPTSIMEVFSDRIRARRLDYTELDEERVWTITVPRDLTLLELAGPILPKIKATLQCFVSRYTLSQEWGRAFMEHPAELDGVIYTGRQSGLPCLALFGDTDPAKGLWHQRSLKHSCLGKLTEWEGFYPLLAKTGARVVNLPAIPPLKTWR